MADIIEIKPSRVARANLEAQLRNLRHDASTLQQQADGQKLYLQNADRALAQAKGLLDAVSGDLIPYDLQARCGEHIKAHVAQVEKRNNDAKKIVVAKTREASRAFDKQVEVRMAISRLETAARQVTVDEVKQAIASHPNVETGSVGFVDRGATGMWIRWNFRDVVLHVREGQNDYHWINGGGEVNIKLGPIRVLVEPNTGTVEMKPLRGQGDRHPYGYSGDEAVHPHVLSRDSICLGSFGESVQVALQEGRWAEASEILLAFLGKVDEDDCAGCRWPAWVMHSPGFPEGQQWDCSESKEDWMEARKHFTDHGIELHCDSANGTMTVQEWENLLEAGEAKGEVKITRDTGESDGTQPEEQNRDEAPEASAETEEAPTQEASAEAPAEPEQVADGTQPEGQDIPEAESQPEVSIGDLIRANMQRA